MSSVQGSQSQRDKADKNKAVTNAATLLGEARKEIVFASRPLGFQIGPESKQLAVVTALETEEARRLGVWVGAKIRSVDGNDCMGAGANYDRTCDLLQRKNVSENSPLTIVFGDVFEKGDAVLGNRRGEGIWYRAKIIEGSGDKYSVRYRDGVLERNVPVYHIVKRPDKDSGNKDGRPQTRYGRNLEYEIGRKIGAGSFGQVYLGKDILTQESVAIKFEDQRAPVPQLYHEFKIMHKCMNTGVEGIPRGLWCEDMDKHRVLIMDLLGPSLEDLFNFCGRQFNLKTTLMLADQMVARLETFHKAEFIHRDIKTDNFCMGLRKGALRVVNLIDFGLSKQYVRSNGKHIPIKTGKSLTGTPRYASVNVHKGIEPSRRDDLESAGYLFLYFLKSKLPWQGQQAATREQKYRKIMTIKQNRLKEVCNGLPEAFYKYESYCRKLEFTDEPNYKYLKDLFKTAFQEEKDERTGEKLVLDHRYDWVVRLENKNYKAQDINSLPTLMRFKSEERKHAEQIEKMMTDGELEGVDPEEVERTMAEMEGITRDILGELDQQNDVEENLGIMYRAVTDRSTRYRNASDGADHDSIEKVRGKEDNGGNTDGCCTIL